MVCRSLAIALVALAAFATAQAQAQSYPAKPIRLIVPFDPMVDLVPVASVAESVQMVAV